MSGVDQQQNNAGANGPVESAVLSALLADVMNAGAAVLVTWTDEDKTFVRNMAKRYHRRLKKISTSRGKGKAAVQDRIFFAEHSFAGRFSAVLLGHPKNAPKLTLEAAKGRAKQVNLRKASVESIHVREIAKADGGFRPISSFGPLDAAAKRLADDMMRVTMGDSPYEYSRRGRGRDAAIRSWRHAYEKGGARRFARSDLKDCYQSVAREALYKLIPLPKAIIENTILIPQSKHISLYNAPHTSEETVRSGLPLGSRPSAFIASKVLESLVDDLPSARMAMSHGDDILVGVRTDEELEDVKNALATRAAQHPTGPFKLKMLDSIRVGVPNDYLGYMLRHRDAHFGGGIRFSASRRSILRFQRRAAREAIFVPPKRLMEWFQKKCLAWVRSHAEWGAGEFGVTIGVIEFFREVQPALNAFHWLVRRHKLKFKSLGAYQALFDRLFLPFVGGSDAERAFTYWVSATAWPRPKRPTLASLKCCVSTTDMALSLCA